MRAEVDIGRRLTPVEADRYYMKQSVQYILNHPYHAIGLSLKKAALFFNNYEVKGVDDLYFAKKKSKILSMIPLGMGVLVILSGVGVYYLFETRQYRNLVLLVGLLLATLASNIIIFVTWRYRIFNIVPLFLLASFGLLSFQTMTFRLKDNKIPLKNRLLKLTSAVLIPMVLCGFLAYFPLIGDKKKSNLSRQALSNEKLSKKANGLLKELQRMEHQTTKHPAFLFKKAVLLKKLHRHSEAFTLFKSVYEKKNYYSQAIYHYLIYLLWLGEYDIAKNMIQDLQQDNPALVLKVQSKLRGTEKEAFMVFVKKSLSN